MGTKIFTAEEPAELALFDAEVDDEPLSMEEIRASRERDRLAKMERLDHRERRIAEYQREYYAANKDAIAEYKRNYYYRERGARDDIRRRRKDLRMSQSEVAKRVGVSTSLISMIELGRVKENAEIMREIYRALGMGVTA